MQVRLDQKKLHNVISYIAGMKVRMDDFSVPLTAGAKRAKEDTLRDFDTEGGFSGEPWAPIAATTRKRDRYKDKRVSAMGRPTTIHRALNLSGRFRNSVAYFVEKFSGGITLGPAYYLNFFGTTNPKTGATKNPAREAGYISLDTIDWTVSAILAYAVHEESKAA
jgi:hypothetical protein